MVAGHVDAVGQIAQVAPRARGDRRDRASTGATLLRYVVEKGSIAVDGISLTVNAVDAETFTVSLIPHTQTATTLAQKGAGAHGEPGSRSDRQVRREAGQRDTGDDVRRRRIARVVDALEDIRAGKMVILVDDEDRENEGDLTMAAEKVTPEAINFMAKYGRGLICLTLTEEKADALELPLQSARKRRLAVRHRVHGVASRRATA